MEEADQLSDRIGIIDQGKIIALDTPARLKDRIQQKDIIRLEIAGWYDELGGASRRVPGLSRWWRTAWARDRCWKSACTLKTRGPSCQG